MTAHFSGPGRDRFSWEMVHVPTVAWDMLERFGWRRVDYGPDVEAWGAGRGRHQTPPHVPRREDPIHE